MARPRFTKEALLEAAHVLHSQPREVKFQEVDAAGTIYFPRVLEYFGDAYMGLLSSGGLDVAGEIRRAEWFAPLAHAEADYLAPMRFGDRVRVEVVRTELGRSSALIGYRIRGAGDETVRAVGQTAHVFVDGRSFKPIEIPAAARQALSGQG